ncbi:MAG: hypothetical protein K2I75_07000 [Clostridiales bacterium]|nr:hypothetical protein [Clostridiales bacterium]
MEEKQKKILQWVFIGIMGVGFILIIVGMFLGLVQSEQLKLTYKLVGDEKWALHSEMVTAASSVPGASNTFSEFDVSSTLIVISFVVAIVGAALFIVYAVLKNVLQKNVKKLGIVAGVLTVAGAALIVVGGFALADNLNKLYWYVLDPEHITWNNDPSFFSIGTGIYLGLVGGIIAAVAGIVSALKPFQD